jgi:hypothetical protein
MDVTSGHGLVIDGLRVYERLERAGRYDDFNSDRTTYR